MFLSQNNVNDIVHKLIVIHTIKNNKWISHHISILPVFN